MGWECECMFPLQACVDQSKHCLCALVKTRRDRAASAAAVVWAYSLVGTFVPWGQKDLGQCCLRNDEEEEGNNAVGHVRDAKQTRVSLGSDGKRTSFQAHALRAVKTHKISKLKKNLHSKATYSSSEHKLQLQLNRNFEFYLFWKKEKGCLKKFRTEIQVKRNGKSWRKNLISAILEFVLQTWLDLNVLSKFLHARFFSASTAFCFIFLPLLGPRLALSVRVANMRPVHACQNTHACWKMIHDFSVHWIAQACSIPFIHPAGCHLHHWLTSRFLKIKIFQFEWWFYEDLQLILL